MADVGVALPADLMNASLPGGAEAEAQQEQELNQRELNVLPPQERFARLRERTVEEIRNRVPAETWNGWTADEQQTFVRRMERAWRQADPDFFVVDEGSRAIARLNRQRQALVSAGYGEAESGWGVLNPLGEIDRQIEQQASRPTRPLLTEGLERGIALMQNGRPVDQVVAFDELTADEVLGMASVLESAVPEQRSAWLPALQRRGQELYKENTGLDLLTVTPSEQDDADEMPVDPRSYALTRALRSVTDAPTENGESAVARAARAFFATSGAAGASLVMDLQQWADERVARGVDGEPTEAYGNNPLSRDNRVLGRFAYGNDNIVQEMLGTGLMWQGGVNAILRRSVGQGAFRVNPISLRGIAETTAASGAIGAAMGPEYAPSLMADAMGVEPSRLTSAIEAAGIDASLGMFFRWLGDASAMRRARHHPDFADLADLPDREFRDAVFYRLRERMGQVRDADVVEPPTSTVDDAVEAVDDVLEEAADVVDDVGRQAADVAEEAAEEAPPTSTVDDAVEAVDVPERDPLIGQEGTVRTPGERGDIVSTRWRVIEADDLVTSGDEGYEQALQPRDRSRAAGRGQVLEIANNLNPEELGDSPRSNAGAPLINAERMVLSGNGRTAALREAYANIPQRAQAYREWLRGEAEARGINAEAVDAMQAPVLVREVTSYGDMTAEEFARQSNKSGLLGMSPGEQAAADARILRTGNLLETFRPAEDGDVLAATNRDFLNAFIEATGDRASLINADGSNYVAERLVPRVRNAVLAAVLGFERRNLLAKLSDAPEGIKRQRDAVMEVAPSLVALKDTPYDLGPALGRVMEDFVRFKESGTPWDMWINQTALFQSEAPRSDVEERLLRLMAGAKSKKAVTDVLDRYAGLARKQDLTTDSMFGDSLPTAEELLQLADDMVNKADAVQGSMFDAAGSGSPQGPVRGREGVRAVEDAGTVEETSTGGPSMREDAILERVASDGGERYLVRASNGEGQFVQVRYPHLENFKGAEFPELLALAKELTNNEVFLNKRLRRAGGRAVTEHGGNTAYIEMNPTIFKRPHDALAVLAHELGHIEDWLGTRTIKGKNLLGKLAAIRGFRKQVFKWHNWKDLRAELKELDRWWMPWEPSEAAQWYRAYRESDTELYAQALSVLLVAPRELKARAPGFYSAFFDLLERKPTAFQALEDLQHLLRQPYKERLRRRRKDLRQGFERTGEAYMEYVEKMRNSSSPGAWYDGFIEELHWVYWPAVRRARKAAKTLNRPEVALRVEWFFDAHPLSGGKKVEWLKRVHERVAEPLMRAGLTQQDLGEYLTLNRIANEFFEDATGRSQVFNPVGLDDFTARVQQADLRRTVAGEQLRGKYDEKSWYALSNAADNFHELVFEVMQNAYKAGLLPTELYEKVKANKGNYAAFMALKYIDQGITGSLQTSVGNLGDIGNPFTFTLLKMEAVQNWMMAERTKQYFVSDWMREFTPEELVRPPQKVGPNGKPYVTGAFKKPDNTTELTLMEAGRRVLYYVPSDVAEMLETTSPRRRMETVELLITKPFRGFIYNMLIRFNPKFQLVFSPIRDMKRTFVNFDGPIGTSARVAGETARSMSMITGIPAARGEVQDAVLAYLRGGRHPLISEMVNVGALGTPFDSFGRQLMVDDAYAEMMVRLKLARNPNEQRNVIRRFWNATAQKVLNGIEFAGLIIEYTPKVAGYKALTRDLGWDRGAAADFVRNNLGVPNVKKAGYLTRYINDSALNPFIVVAKNGLLADVKQAARGAPKNLKGDKTSRSGWWLRWWIATGLYRFMQALGAAGALGATVKLWYDGKSEYEKTNYQLIPLGFVEGEGSHGIKPFGIRIPEDETHRVLNATMHKAIQAVMGDGANVGPEVLDFWGSQVPSIAPMIEIGAAWTAFSQGKNPTDAFRGQPIIDPDHALTRGWPATQDMLVWTAGKLGLTSFYRYNADAGTTTEAVLSNLPLLQHIFTFSDYGYIERDYEQIQDEARWKAQRRLAYSPDVRDLQDEYMALRRLGYQRRNSAQNLRYMELQMWHSSMYSLFDEMVVHERVTEGQAKDFAETLNERTEAWLEQNGNRNGSSVELIF